MLGSALSPRAGLAERGSQGKDAAWTCRGGKQQAAQGNKERVRKVCGQVKGSGEQRRMLNICPGRVGLQRLRSPVQGCQQWCVLPGLRKGYAASTTADSRGPQFIVWTPILTCPLLPLAPSHGMRAPAEASALTPGFFQCSTCPVIYNSLIINMKVLKPLEVYLDVDVCNMNISLTLEIVTKHGNGSLIPLIKLEVVSEKRGSSY